MADAAGDETVLLVAVNGGAVAGDDARDESGVEGGMSTVPRLLVCEVTILGKKPQNSAGFGRIRETQTEAPAVLEAPRGVAARHRRSFGVTTLSPTRKRRKVEFSPSPGRVERQCAKCGRSIFVPPSSVTASGKNYCDRSCRIADLTPIDVLFFRAVEKLPSGCWRYRGGDTKNGYRKINLIAHGRGYVLAHRIGYELHKGPIPDGLVIDHLCFNKWCVNPDHLEAVTQTENVRRATSYPFAEVCVRGHQRTPENTVYRKNGRIHDCLDCRRERQAAEQT